MIGLIRFYKGEWKGESLPLNDDFELMAEFVQIWKSNNFTVVADKALKKTAYWGEDLTKIKGLTEAITIALESIDIFGISEGFEKFSSTIK